MTSTIEILDDVIEEHRRNPVDMLNTGDRGEYAYLLNQRDAYIRTIHDVTRLLGGKGRILELGSFMGIVSITLSRLGYEVVAQDIPEFHACERLSRLYEKHGVKFEAVNLRGYHFSDHAPGSFDAVIACEILEHLNFNPLPVLQDLNRILKLGGILYVGMPNQASLRSRIRLFCGKSIHNPISDFFAQLDRMSNMIVGLHWREYTQAETIEMLSRMGFDVEEAYYFSPNGSGASQVKTLAKRLVFTVVPSFQPFQVVTGRKRAESSQEFWFTEANT
jgi:2-polyprenyl-3-methyl-5-hydroxy-6-metoxy-1,4-benzoquinol methylase